ncbi:hypothetical protein G9A89_019051 [Geosiphon pyriformis]|nr:hypothetical protein G9A89_019051 [Geosiphon pyriformis]
MGIGNRKPPFHDHLLIFNILNGTRLEITSLIPACYAELLEKCRHFNPEDHPTAKEVQKLIRKMLEKDETTNCSKVIIHPGAVYTNRLLTAQMVDSSTEHAFCNFCLSELVLNENDKQASPTYKSISCPNCRERVNSLNFKISKYLTRLIGSLKIRCENRGCEWVGSCLDLDLHKDRCSQMIVSCPNKCRGCPWEFIRENMENHVKVCNYRVAQCTIS